MKLKDLPESVTFSLDEESGIKYPKKGDFETTYELTLLCFSKKTYVKTWPLRQRLLQVFISIAEKIETLGDRATDTGDESTQMNGEDLENACMIGGFDAQAALEEFKQAIIGNDLILLDGDTPMNKQRWSMVDSFTQEAIMFEYLANFIQPCVTTGKVTS